MEQKLKDWLAEPARQRATQNSIEAYAHAWRRGPVWRLFEAALGENDAHDAEAIARIAATVFADDGWTDTLIDSLCEQLRSDPMFRPPLRVLSNELLTGLLVYENGQVSIAASIIDRAQLAAKKSGPRGPTSINFLGRLSVFKFVRAGDALLSFWETEPITAGFTAADAAACRRTGERRLGDGEILVVDSRRQSFVIEHARSNIMLLEASIALGEAPLKVEYDSSSLAYVSCSATDEETSRIQVISTLARKLGAAEAFDAIVPFLDHRDFFLRWHVIKELLGIDADAALPYLKKMAAGDPHPEPRRAARAMLEHLTELRRDRAA